MTDQSDIKLKQEDTVETHETLQVLDQCAALRKRWVILTVCFSRMILSGSVLFSTGSWYSGS